MEVVSLLDPQFNILYVYWPMFRIVWPMSLDSVVRVGRDGSGPVVDGESEWGSDPWCGDQGVSVKEDRRVKTSGRNREVVTEPKGPTGQPLDSETNDTCLNGLNEGRKVSGRTWEWQWEEDMVGCRDGGALSWNTTTLSGPRVLGLRWVRCVPVSEETVSEGVHKEYHLELHRDPREWVVDRGIPWR